MSLEIEMTLVFMKKRHLGLQLVINYIYLMLVLRNNEITNIST